MRKMTPGVPLRTEWAQWIAAQEAALRALIAEMRDMPSDDRIQRWADRLAALLPKE